MNRIVKFIFIFITATSVSGCEMVTFNPARIVSAEYVNENTCKIGYTGNWQDMDFSTDIFIRNSDRSGLFYHAQNIEYLSGAARTDETRYILWQADRNRDAGHIIEVSGQPDVKEFQVP